ncbi:hypothetical protein HF521_000048 [Silurus meridionalis]|uniref:Uncharacterized protein n=1 Tax=Silurus meridionalis TaxID=175797 RepID=A0A8T0BZG3_SILME|nr:hypothetical protein HF521_000048 [Silurus meridionalis]
MKNMWDTVWTVWSLGTEVYNYIQTNKADEHIGSLSRQVEYLQMHTQQMHTQQMHTQHLLHQVFTLQDIIIKQQCVICVLIALLMITCTLLITWVVGSLWARARNFRSKGHEFKSPPYPAATPTGAPTEDPYG